MARTGSFGGGLPTLRPFGGTGSFTQYNIGDLTSTGESIADLELYKIQVGWSNGQVDDATYLDALQKAIARAPIDSTKRVSAQNTYDDAVYSIGRANVQATGNDDALIAFDQSSLAKMTPGNKRYTDLQQTLDAELANRRSKTYGTLVDAYNNGQGTTDTLINAVTSTLAGLSPNAPDYDNWKQTLDDLKQRKLAEQDAKAAQDYQFNRIKAPAYLAYLASRRDMYLPGSPQYATWDRQIEDTGKQVKDQALQDADTAFYTAYNAGHKSEASLILYIRRRIDQMEPDDPTKGQWQAKLDTAVFSDAESKLIADVSATKPKRPVSDLVAFYKHYQSTLNPGSIEWRNVQGKIDQWNNTDMKQNESLLQWRVAHNEAPTSDLIAFYQKQVNTLPKGSPDWRTAVDNRDAAANGAFNDAAALAEWKALHPGQPISTFVPPAGSGVGSTVPSSYPSGDETIGTSGNPPKSGTQLPTGGGSSTGPLPAPGSHMYLGQTEQFAGGRYTDAQLNYVANRIAAGTGLDPRAVKIWVIKEEGHLNNPLGVSSGGDRKPPKTKKGHASLASFSTVDKGIDSAISWINTHGNMSGIKASAGKSVAAQLAAIDASPWGPGGNTPGGGYPKGGVQAVAAKYGVHPVPASPGVAPIGSPVGPTVNVPGAPPNYHPGTQTPVKGPGSDTSITSTPPTNPDWDQLVGLLAGRLAIKPGQPGYLKPGTPDWITVSNQLDAAKANAAKPPAVDPQAFNPHDKTKVIKPNADATTVLNQMKIDSGSSPAAVAIFHLNHDELYNAFQGGDKKWLFHDPANPDAVTAKRDKNGDIVKGADGKPVMIRGSFYVDVSTAAVANVEGMWGNYNLDMSESARASGQNKDAADYQTTAANAFDSQRGIDNTIAKRQAAVTLNGDGTHHGLKSAMDDALDNGDIAAALNIKAVAQGVIADALTDPTLDAATVAGFQSDAQGMTDKVPDAVVDPVHSTYVTDPKTGKRTLVDAVLTPGYHLTQSTTGGTKKYAVTSEDNMVPGEWQNSHVTVHVAQGDAIRSPEIEVNKKAPVDLRLIVTDSDGKSRYVPLADSGISVSALSFFDGSGVQQNAYSLDGRTWIRPNAGVLPVLSVADAGVKRTGYDANGNYVEQYVHTLPAEMQGGTPTTNLGSWLLGAQREKAVVTITNGQVSQVDQGQVDWFNAGAAKTAAAKNPLSDPAIAHMIQTGATKGEILAAIASSGGHMSGYNGPEVGAPGQRMTVAYAADDGSINMLPPGGRGIGPDISSTGQFNPVTDLVGKTPAQLAQMAIDDANKRYGGGPSVPSQDILGTHGITPIARAGLGTGLGAVGTPGTPGTGSSMIGPPDARIALSGQLPAGQPARIEGTGVLPPAIKAPTRPVTKAQVPSQDIVGTRGVPPPPAIPPAPAKAGPKPVAKPVAKVAPKPVIKPAALVNPKSTQVAGQKPSSSDNPANISRGPAPKPVVKPIPKPKDTGTNVGTGHPY